MTAYPAPRDARRGIAILILLAFVTSMDLTLTALLIEPMKRDLGLTDVEIGLLQGTVFGLSYGLSSLPMGWLIDRGNRRVLLIAGVLVWAIGMIGSGLAGGFAFLALWRVALGLVTGLLVPASLSMIADLFAPERRSVATSLFAGGQAAGQAFGILAGGVLFDRLAASPDLAAMLAPWRMLYVAAGAICVLLAIVLLGVREPARQEGRKDYLAGNGWRELWSYRGLLLPLLGGLLFAAIAMQAANVWAAPLLIRRFGLTPGSFAGWLSLVTLIGLILGALAGGQLAELGRRRRGRAGVLLPAVFAALAAAPLSLFALAPNVGSFAALLALDLFCAGLIPTVGVIAIALNIPNEIRGRAIGSYVLVTAVLGTATAPAAIAFISRALGGETMLGHAIVIVSVPAALAAAACFLVAMRRDTGEPAGFTLT